MPKIQMIQINWRFVFTLVVLLIISGCEQQKQKTDSQIFRENAIEKAQIPIHKAIALLTAEALSQPENHLDDLVIVSKLVIEAKHSYQTSQITSYTDPQLEMLETQLDNLEPTLVELAKTLLHQAVNQTQSLRKQIEEAKNRPYSSTTQNTSSLVDFLGDKYNKQIKSCCLRKLGNIQQVLTRNVQKHREMIKLIHGINNELGKVIQTKEYAQQLHKQISSL